MKLFNFKLEKVVEFREVTYHENVMVQYGFCDVHNIYSIAELKRRGFIEIPEKKLENSVKKETLETETASQSKKEKLQSLKKTQKPGKTRKSGVKI